MGIKYSFVDNMEYGPDDINEIAGCLVGAGIMPFETKDSYNVSDLNTVTSALTTNGTSLGGCECSAENTGTEDMRIRVSEGIIFFESGVKLIVDAEGYLINVTPNTAGFVFAHYNPSLQIADIVFESELPNDGEYVELAHVSASGVLTGTRQHARSKVGTMGTNATQTITLTSQEPELQQDGGYILARARGVNLSDYNYVYITEARAENEYNASNMGLYDIKTQTFLMLINVGRVWYNPPGEGLFTNNGAVLRYFKIIDGELCLVIYKTTNESYDIDNFPYTATFS